MSAIYRMVKYAVSPHEERNAAKTASFTPGFYGRWPKSIGLYYVGDGVDYKSQRMDLRDEAGEHLYAMTFHDGYGSRQMTLYTTTDYTPPLLALAVNQRGYSSDGIITLPAPAGGEAGTGSNNSRTEKLKYHSLKNSYTFTVPVGQGDQALPENFEWREDKKPKPKIRRLYRSTGEELAIWREGSVPNRQGRLATLEFVNSGATDEMGELWTLLAVVSALRVCQSQWTALTGASVQSQEKYISWHADETGTKKTNTEPFWDYRTPAQAKPAQ